MGFVGGFKPACCNFSSPSCLATARKSSFKLFLHYIKVILWSSKIKTKTPKPLFHFHVKLLRMIIWGFRIHLNQIYAQH